VVGEGAEPREGSLIAAVPVEHGQSAHDLAPEDEGLAAEAVDALRPDPFRPHESPRVPLDILYEKGDARGPHPAYLAHPQGKAPKSAVEARPVLTGM
jgi:hypothetical protein